MCRAAIICFHIFRFPFFLGDSAGSNRRQFLKVLPMKCVRIVTAMRMVSNWTPPLRGPPSTTALPRHVRFVWASIQNENAIRSNYNCPDALCRCRQCRPVPFLKLTSYRATSLSVAKERSQWPLLLEHFTTMIPKCWLFREAAYCAFSDRNLCSSSSSQRHILPEDLNLLAGVASSAVLSTAQIQHHV